MDTKNIGTICPKKYKLSKPLCQDNSDIQRAEYTDHYIDGVTYRVWSAFEGRTDAAESLENLMHRRLGSGEKVGEVVDEFEKFIKRKNSEFLSVNFQRQNLLIFNKVPAAEKFCWLCINFCDVMMVQGYTIRC